MTDLSDLLLDRIARTTYVDAVYCYRPSSVVCRSIGRSVTLVSPAKTASPIEMPFWLRTRMGPRNHVLDGGQGISSAITCAWCWKILLQVL